MSCVREKQPRAMALGPAGEGRVRGVPGSGVEWGERCAFVREREVPRAQRRLVDSQSCRGGALCGVLGSGDGGGGPVIRWTAGSSLRGR